MGVYLLIYLLMSRHLIMTGPGKTLATPPARKHVKGRAALHARTGLLGAVRPVLGTVPSIRAIPGKVAKHPTHEPFDLLARQRVESTTERYGDPWVVGCQ